MNFLKTALEKFQNIFFRRTKVNQRQLGRNDPCWCGSGKKYKRCHLESDKKSFDNPGSGSNNPLSPGHRRMLGHGNYEDW